MFYPFLPGSYDGLAVTLSAMSQLFAMVGLLLVPCGAVWLVCERWQATAATPTAKRCCELCGVTSLVAGSIVAIVVALGATIDAHISFAVLVLMAWGFSAIGFAKNLRRRPQIEERRFNPMPLYLIALPLIAALLKFTLVAPAAEFSRKVAIRRANTLIDDIERFRETRGHYPLSLQSLNEDYKPGVIGVERYHYELNGEGYNVYFQHIAVALDVKEIVMFNQRGEHEYTSHNSDILQYPPEQLARSRGYIAVRDTPDPKWKYFLFD
jgi:hypothetical protein